MPRSARTQVQVWKKRRIVYTGSATQRVSPRDTAMKSEERDISETSNSANFNWRQNISDAVITDAVRRIASGAMRPSMIGRVRALSVRAMLSSSICRYAISKFSAVSLH